MTDPRFLMWQERITALRQSIPAHVRLIAVTKTMPADAIRAAYAAGIRDVAESRVQEAIDKQAQLTDLTDLTWHFIGSLQSNKALKALTIFNWIQSVDSLKLAQRLDRLVAENQLVIRQPIPQLCLQVKLLSDPTKGGWEPAALLAAIPMLDRLTHVQICGLMVIPPYGLSPLASAEVFQAAQQLAQTIQLEIQRQPQIQRQPWQQMQMQQLSMGMSDDYEIAIANGATMIRPGSCLFGERPI
jgi:PLP dependent protein